MDNRSEIRAFLSSRRAKITPAEVSTRSEAFRTRWAAHNVRLHNTGAKHFRHPVVGELHLTYESMEMPGDPGLTMLVFTAAPGTPSADGLRMLASWSATHDTEITRLAGEPRSR